MNNPSDLIVRYHDSDKWYEKALIILVYHTIMSGAVENWTMRMTAKKLDRSVGLISEDIRLAQCIKDHDDMLKLPDRQSAMKKMREYV
jgi:glucan phosphorylase